MTFASKVKKEDHAHNTKGVATCAANLLDQQLWCWGKDIGFHGGNLLLRYGFQRIKKPPGSSVPSIYQLNMSSAARVVLRGFGVFYGDDRWGGLFLRRYEFCPRLTSAADLPRPAWLLDDLPSLTEPANDDDIHRSRRLLSEVLAWFHAYEEWIAEAVGLDYRRETLVSWKPKDYIVIPAEEMAPAWRSLVEATEVLVDGRCTDCQ